MPFRALREKFVARISGRSFQRFASLLHQGPDIAASDFTLTAKFLRELGNEAGVLHRCPSAQPMIEMTHHQIFEPSPNQKVQQSHRIRPAGNADKIAAPLRGAGKPRNIGGTQHFRTLPDERRSGNSDPGDKRINGDWIYREGAKVAKEREGDYARVRGKRSASIATFPGFIFKILRAPLRPLRLRGKTSSDSPTRVGHRISC